MVSPPCHERTGAASPHRKDPMFAAAASFVWGGMGQAYNGQYGKGILFFTGVMVGLLAFLVPGIIVWAFGIYDAYVTAQKVNDGVVPYRETGFFHLLGFVLLTIALIFVFAVATVFLLLMAGLAGYLPL
jgi:TM2 domain-containing membrane protein YozV